MVNIGKCGVCGTLEKTLNEHHIVEAPLDKYDEGKPPSTCICKDCHLQQEKYRSYLKNVCNIEIDTKKASEDTDK